MLADSMESQCHMFWAFPKLSEFWQQFFKTIKNILDINLNDQPHIFPLLFFGKLPDNLIIRVVLNNILDLSLLYNPLESFSWWGGRGVCTYSLRSLSS